MIALFKKRFLLVASLICCSIFAVFASDVFFKHVEASAGLSNNRVNAVFKDSRGYMWFGTASGLNRWDGTDMKVFLSDSRNAKSLPDNNVTSIQETRDGLLWIETGSGYAVYDPKTEDFDCEMNAILSKMGINEVHPDEIKIDRSHNIWLNVKGEGVYYYKPSMKLLYEFTFNDQQQGLPEGEIVSLSECQEGVVACYSNGRLICLDGERQRIIWQEDYVIEHEGGANDFYYAFADRKDNIWLWNTNKLFIYKKASGEWLNSLEELAKGWNTNLPKANDLHIRCMAQDSKGLLWIGTESAGLVLVDPNAKTIESVTSDDSNSRTLRSNNIQSLFVDKNDVVWVGTAKHGASYFSDNNFKFDVDWLGDITALVQDASGNFWYGTSDKGVLYRTSSGETKEYNRQNSSLPSDIISCLAISGNRIWVGSTRGGLSYIENGKVTVLEATDEDSESVSNAIQALDVDAHGNLWIGTSTAGLQLWSASTGGITTYSVESGHLPNNSVTSIKKSGNKLLIGTNAGLCVMQIDSKKFKTYIGNEKGDASFRSTSVTSVYGDSRGFYWVGSREGLSVYDPKTDCLASIGFEQGLASESILSITEDAQKNMWLTTAAGVSKILVQSASQGKFPSSFAVLNYNQQDGLQSTSFNQNAILNATDGTIMFAGMSGINSIEPKEQNVKLQEEHLFFTRLYLNGAEVEIRKTYDGVEILPMALFALDKLSLPHASSIQIGVASDCFTRSEGLQYVYKLDGVDNAWVTGGKNGIIYENLPSGSHTLHVKSIGAKGEELTIEIVVANIFWLTGTAFFIYFLIIAAVVLWILWMRPRRKAKISEFKAMQDQLKTLQEIAEEFRAPVSTMIPPLNSLVEEEEDSRKREYLTTVHYQATQLLSLTNKLQSLFQQETVNDTINDFKVKNTVVEEEVSDVAKEKEKRDTKPVTRYHVLLVDDNEEYLNFLKDSMPETFDVLTATTAEAAWEQVCTEHPQLVVCESDMQDMSGSELCIRMKSDRIYDRIPFILVTDSASASEIGDNGINNRVTSSADDYVAKPFNIQVLISHMNTLLGIREDGVESNVDEDESAIESRAIAATMDEQLRISAEQFVLQNVSRSNLSVEEMAKSLNMSRAHLYKKITAITGKTPIEFIRYVRIKQAGMLLRQGAYTTEDVATETGFNNVDSFVKFFRDEFECSPEEYRKQNR